MEKKEIDIEEITRQLYERAQDYKNDLIGPAILYSEIRATLEILAFRKVV